MFQCKSITDFNLLPVYLSCLMLRCQVMLRVLASTYTRTYARMHTHTLTKLFPIYYIED